MKTLTHKLEQIEKNVINDKPNPEETYLGTTNKTELELFRVAYKILENHTKQLNQLEEQQKAKPTVNYSEKKETLVLSDEAKTVVSQAERIMFLRATHIFDETIAPLFHIDESLCKKLFYAHFFWFLSEMQDMLHHRYMELKIMGEADFFNLSTEEQGKKLTTCYDTWREWFTKESRLQWLKNNPITSLRLN